MAKRRFRKVYVVTAEANIFTIQNYQSVLIYREKQEAERICVLMQRDAIDESTKIYNANRPIPQYKVHGFYLIHEQYFEEKEH